MVPSFEKQLDRRSYFYELWSNRTRVFNTAKKEIKNDYCYELVDVVRAMMSNMVEGVSVGDSLGEFWGCK